jgi:exosortase
MSIRARLWLLLSLAALWLPVVYLLGAQWSIYEQYSYGWAVPFLCLFFAYRRFSFSGTADASPVFFGSSPKVSTPLALRSPLHAPRLSNFQLFSLSVFLLLLVPLRVLQDANPLWRLASYLLVTDAAAITLLLISILGGSRNLWRFAFPTLFFFVAVPWPTPVETWVVQSLTRINTVAVIELLHAFSVPAVARGNVIELVSGAVGIEEACSGIRSLQAVLMLSLAFGEWFWLGTKRRIHLIGSGILVALVLNIVRTMILSVLTAQGGPALAHRWHDTTGIVLLVGCFTLVWLIAFYFARRAQKQGLDPQASLPLKTGISLGMLPRLLGSAPSISSARSILIIVFSLVAVIGSEIWFRHHEAFRPAEKAWSIILPRGNSRFREMARTDEVRAKLQYDSAETGIWQESQGTVWQFFYFRWNAASSLKGSVRVQLAKSHRPEICLPASGWQLRKEFPRTAIDLHGLPLIFRTYEFSIHDRSAFVFFCVREDGTTAGSYGNMRESHGARWKAAMNGNRGLGQRVIEIALTGPATRAEAEQLLRSELPRLIAFH